MTTLRLRSPLVRSTPPLDALRRSARRFATAVGGVLLAAWCVVWPAVLGAQSAASEDPAARRLYDAAQRRLNGDPAGAAEELDLLVRQFARDVLAPQALADLARIRLGLGDQAAATQALERLLSEYPRSRQAADAFVLRAEILVDGADGITGLERARDEFRRVPLLFGTDAYPDLPARAVARVRSAELGLRLGDPSGAIAELVQAIEDEPPSTSTGRARLILGRALLDDDQWVQAAEVLQSLVDDVPLDAEGNPQPEADAPSATVRDRSAALRLLTLVHRHRIRPDAGQPRWAKVERFATELALDEPIGVAADEEGRILIVDEGAEVASLRHADTGIWERRPLKNPARPTFVGSVGVVATEEHVQLPFDGQSVRFLEPDSSRDRTLDKIQVAIRGRGDEWFVLARGYDGVLRYTSPRQGGSILGATRPDFVDLDRDDLGRVLLLAERESRVLRLGLDRRSADVLVTDTSWKKPTALARDGLDQIYVLDRGLRQIFVYDPQGRRIEVLGPTFAGQELRSPVDLAVDGAGRIYIADAKSSALLVLD